LLSHQLTAASLHGGEGFVKYTIQGAVMTKTGFAMETAIENPFIFG
jgi:hypothetical protein